MLLVGAITFAFSITEYLTYLAHVATTSAGLREKNTM